MNSSPVNQTNDLHDEIKECLLLTKVIIKKYRITLYILPYIVFLHDIYLGTLCRKKLCHYQLNKLFHPNYLEIVLGIEISLW